MAVLGRDFYDRPVLEVARDLIGRRISHSGVAGTIVETEAYHDSEPACHAFVGVTPRTEILFGEPGRAYVYRSYGIHALLNAVCEPEGVGAAVLIRALAPVEGIELMRGRRFGRGSLAAVRGAARDQELSSGPGKLTQALGIELGENGSSLQDGPVLFEAGSDLESVRAAGVVSGPRVGITKAVELPWRFCLAGDPNVSRPRPSAWRLGAVAA